ncbi:MAG: hypothetical protein LKM38_17270 [Pseudomonas veronii]|nr:hypothetical protein [Pseudomonas veronii]
MPTGSRPTLRCWGTMLSQLHLIRAFEETVLELAGEGLVHGPAHSSIGQEGGAVGSIVALGAADEGQRLAPWSSPVPGQGAGLPDARGYRPESAGHCTHPGSAATYPGGNSSAWPKGSAKAGGGSMHLQWAEAGALGDQRHCGPVVCRWRPVPPGHTGMPGPTPWRSPILVTAR